MRLLILLCAVLVFSSVGAKADAGKVVAGQGFPTQQAKLLQIQLDKVSLYMEDCMDRAGDKHQCQCEAYGVMQGLQTSYSNAVKMNPSWEGKIVHYSFPNKLAPNGVVSGDVSMSEAKAQVELANQVKVACGK